MAAGILSPEDARELVESTVDAKGSQLLDDLNEETSAGLPWGWNGGAKEQFRDYPACIGLTPEQICRLQGVGLLGHYTAYEPDNWRMHRVVRMVANHIDDAIAADLTWG